MSSSVQTLRDLRHAHVDLLRTLWDGGDDNVRVERVRTFIATIRRAGAALAPGQDRDAAQEILDHWITQLTILSPSTPESDLAGGLDAYQSGSEEGGASSNSRERPDVAREQIRLTALARQWLESGQDPGYLLNGRAVKNASQFRDNDPLLAEFVTASERYEHKMRLRQWSAGVGATAVAVLAIGILFFLYQSAATRVVTLGTRVDRYVRSQGQSTQDDHAVDRSYQTCRHALLSAQNALALFATGNSSGRQCGQNLSGDSTTALNAVTLALDDSSPSAQTGGNETSGTVWLGNDDAPKVTDVSSHPIVLEDIAKGTKIRAARTLALRSGFPNHLGKLANGIGVVPVHTDLVVQDVRKINGQFFAKVSFPSLLHPLIFFQYTDVDNKRAQTVQRELNRRGYAAPGIESIHRLIQSSVKYDADCIKSGAWPGIQKNAEELADTASKILQANNFPGGPVVVKRINNGCKVLNALELWVAFAAPVSISTPGASPNEDRPHKFAPHSRHSCLRCRSVPPP
jgi:hypothetical protein